MTVQPFYITVDTDAWAPKIRKGAIVKIDPYKVPKPGDFVLVEFHYDGPPLTQILTTFEGGGGRDVNGRYCKPGSPKERFTLGCGLAYPSEDVWSGRLKILGKAIEVHHVFN
jgi:hypothetical protein